MSDDEAAATADAEQSPTAVTAVPAPPPAPGDALAGYTARMRRARTRYLGMVATLVLVIGALVAVAWSKSEIHNVHTHVAQHPPAALTANALATLPHVQWHSTDQSAIGFPLTGGTVVTHDQHTVRGRDVRTGAQTWYYKRSDRTVCAAIQQSTVVIAVFRLKGACNELTGLDPQTGRRKWTRTVDMDGYPLLGTPQIQVTAYTILFVSKTVIYAISPTDGGTRYYYAPTSCTINSAVLGNAGLLISQTCSKPVCSGKKFCAPGIQLVLRNATAGRADQYSSDNPDQIQWLLRGNDDVPVASDNLILALDPTTHRLMSLANIDGKPSTIELSPEPTSTQASDPIGLTSGELIRIGEFTYLVPSVLGGSSWGVRTSAAVTVTPTTPSAIPDLSAALIVTTGSDGIQQRSAETGRPQQTFAVGPTDGLAYPAGSGFIVGGSTGTTVYQ